MLLMYVRCQKIGCKDVEWIDLARDKGKWHAFVKTIAIICFLYNAGKFWDCLRKCCLCKKDAAPWM
jgi:hypothetical protein